MMKKTITLLSTAMLFTCNLAIGQTIPNEGFETWTPQGPSENPDGWITNPLGISSMDMNSGSFAIHVEAGDFTNPQTQQTSPVPGRAVTGVPGAMGAPGIEGYAFTDRPDSLTGWYKYTPNGVDECIVAVTLTEWNAANGERDTIATGVFLDSDNPTYARFSFPLVYVSINTPDTCTIQLMSSDPNFAIQGSVLLVDDLAFVTNSLAIGENSLNTLVEVYPNPTADYITISGVESAHVIIYNTNGKIMMESNLENSNSIDLSKLPKGNYLLKIETAQGILSRKISKL